MDGSLLSTFTASRTWTARDIHRCRRFLLNEVSFGSDLVSIITGDCGRRIECVKPGTGRWRRWTRAPLRDRRLFSPDFHHWRSSFDRFFGSDQNGDDSRHYGIRLAWCAVP